MGREQEEGFNSARVITEGGEKRVEMMEGEGEKVEREGGDGGRRAWRQMVQTRGVVKEGGMRQMTQAGGVGQMMQAGKVVEEGDVGRCYRWGGRWKRDV